MYKLEVINMLEVFLNEFVGRDNMIAGDLDGVKLTR